jgi:HPt (histidine-containing phosphotransfer) domain-containing protein
VKVLDIDRLADVFDDSAEIVEVVELLITTADALTKKLEAALQQQQADIGAHLAHELKGAAGNAGAETLSERSRVVELAFREKNWRMVRWALADMQASLAVLHYETSELRGSA